MNFKKWHVARDGKKAGSLAPSSVYFWTSLNTWLLYLRRLLTFYFYSLHLLTTLNQILKPSSHLMRKSSASCSPPVLTTRACLRDGPQAFLLCCCLLPFGQLPLLLHFQDQFHIVQSLLHNKSCLALLALAHSLFACDPQNHTPSL